MMDGWTTKLIRWLLYGSVLVLGLSFAVGHWVAPEAEWRVVLTPPTPVVSGGGSVWFVEGERGRLVEFGAGRGWLDVAAMSPWQDGWRTRQVVGRWIEKEGVGSARIHRASGLARVSYPDGFVLDRVEMSVLPGGPPCWVEARGDVVVFCSTGGVLYRYAFSGSRHPLAVGGRDPEPIAVVRAAGAPEVGEIHDLWRPYGMGGEGLYLASVRRPGARPRQATQEIWWLRLSEDGTELVDGGRLTEGEAGWMARFPVLGRRPSGGVWLAYLVREAQRPDWTLRVVPVEWEPENQSAPIRVSGTARDLVDGCAGSPPAFRADGRRVQIVRPEEGRWDARPRLESVELEDEEWESSRLARGLGVRPELPAF
ncbi:MAG: hypothetical protein KatS3mg108_2055 [Isosphaeraceae bacterium]|jgi:hypothetical protein|nr:MAG: hypothetical protein KatS3mg108_2055 [Isosphaeraceae bacterium]